MKKRSLKLTAFEMFAETDNPIEALIAHIPAGEPIALSDDIEMVDLNYLLTRNTPDALVMRVDGVSMMTEIADGDYIVVSRSLEAHPGDIVVAKINGDITLKRFKRTLRGNQGLYLVPANPDVKTREITRGDDMQILGVVTRILKNLRP